MKSMTGYGKGSASAGGFELTIEVKTVNGRFLEVNNRIPKAFASFDPVVRGMLAKRISRGSADIYYSCRNALGNTDLTVDEALAVRYKQAAATLAGLGIVDDLTASVLLRLPDVVRSDETKISDEIKEEMVVTALDRAIDALIEARSREGTVLARDLRGILDGISERVDAIARRVPEVRAEYEARLRERIRAALDAIPVDEARLANEIALYVDRADVNEEIQRLRSHLSAFGELLGSEAPTGRKMDFLTQEMLREANTLGSKSSDLTLVNLVLEIKNEIEKLKEQSRNAE